MKRTKLYNLKSYTPRSERVETEETLTQPRVLVGRDGFFTTSEYRPGKTSTPVTDIRVQMPLAGTDLVVHVGVTDSGKVIVGYRKARFADDYTFTDLHEYNILEEIQMQRLAK